MTTELWEAKRLRLEADLRKATLDLFEHTGTEAFCVPLNPPHGFLFVAAGTMDAIQETVADAVETPAGPLEKRVAEVRSFLRRPPPRGNHDRSSADQADIRIAAELAIYLYDELQRLQKTGEEKQHG